MRTRSADDDLVVVDLDDPDEVESRGPGDQRRHFEDHYAELPFGLGTVPRRIEPEPWYVRPGVLLWIAIALFGLLALAGSDDGAEGQAGDLFSAGLPSLDARTGSRLALSHVGAWWVLDVDRGSLRRSDSVDLPASSSPSVLRAEPTQFEGTSGTLVVQESVRDIVIAAHGVAFATGRHTVVWRSTRCGGECPVRVTDVRSGGSRTLAQYSARPQPIIASVSPDDSTIAILEYDGVAPYLVRTFDARGRALATAELGSSQPMFTWSPDARWLFAAIGPDLVAVDARSGDVARVDVTLPPFEFWYTARVG